MTKKEIKLSYSKVQLEKAVKFIAINNENYIDDHEYIRNQIIDRVELLARDPEGTMLGTMGFLLMADRENRGTDKDYVSVEIWVDPALGVEEYNWIERKIKL